MEIIFFSVHHFLQFYAIFYDLHFEKGVGDVIYPQVAIVKGAAHLKQHSC